MKRKEIEKMTELVKHIHRQKDVQGSCTGEGLPLSLRQERSSS